ncbi:MAG TPA: N-acetylglucosamine-specific PTS transporter subunit IIBC [Steroidobacteraceae bacterium]|jgi:PTS system N-acetylglucosamine-specific IIC component|nr:N-acetylglucosamine-specific PTS transporter subunit IIBC [Steroidobacteraceae bacterium]
MKLRFGGLQQLGRALMLPIAVLPIAGLLLRLGQPDLLGWAAMASAGDAVFSNLGLLFAVGVGVGLARENHGAAGLAAVVGFLVTTRAVETLLAAPPGTLTKLSIPVGLLSGIIAGHAYNRFSNINLPSYLSFFGGRRFVPIVSGLAGLALAGVLGYAWPLLERGMDATSHAILGAGSFGLFAYGLLNRILIITGLHHILNNFAWFIVGDYHGATGDLKRFFAGDPTAGAFMSGFFPVMMFGLPGACLAMYHAARPERRAAVGGLLLSLGLTSFLTGVTEPVEFTFMFLAPVLFALHAIATGLAMVIMHLVGVRLGFSFSAGLFDYVLNFSHAQRPLLLLPIGAAYFALYYGVFRYCIMRLNLATPGREPDDATAAPPLATATPNSRAQDFVTALGGARNLAEVEACTTRLRLVLNDNTAVDEATLKRLGALGIIRSSAQGLQVVLGPIADQVAGEIRAALRSGTPAEAFLAALGGRGNIVDLATAAGRVLIRTAQPGSVDEPALKKLGVRGIAYSAADSIQILTAGSAEDWAAPLRRLL